MTSASLLSEVLTDSRTENRDWNKGARPSGSLGDYIQYDDDRGTNAWNLIKEIIGDASNKLERAVVNLTRSK